MGYKLKRATIRVNGTEKQIRPAGRLPAEYQEVEWIQSSGTQYIVTPEYITDGHVYKAKFLFPDTPLGWATFGGGYGTSPSDRYFIGSCESYGVYYWGYGFNNDMNYTFGAVQADTDYEVEVKMENGSQYFILDGNTLFTRNFTFSTPYQPYIAVIGNGAPNENYAWRSTRLYYWQLYDTSDNLEMNMIPCYRKADGVIGMYDLVGDTFYTNNGTGTFTKGPDV